MRVRKLQHIAAAVGAAVLSVWIVVKWDMPVSADAPILGVEGTLPDLAALVAAEKTAWLNSPPLTRASLNGKVVVVDFWTYSCINSLRNMPHVRNWAAKYADAGLVVVGVHTPEFGFEKELPNIEKAVREYQITYPVAVDSDYAIWNAFRNDAWPGDYFIDRKGHIRYHHLGEGDYEHSEGVIRQLLRENGGSDAARPGVSLSAPGAEAPPSDEIGLAGDVRRLQPRRKLRLAASAAARPARALYPPRTARAEPLGTRGSVERRRRVGRARGSARKDRVPLPQP